MTQGISLATMNGHACFANLSPAIVPVDVGSVIVLTVHPRSSGPMPWTAFAREGPDVGTAKPPSNEQTKFAALVGKVFVKAACAGTN